MTAVTQLGVTPVTGSALIPVTQNQQLVRSPGIPSVVTSGWAVNCSDGFDPVAFGYQAAAGLSRTMKFSMLVSAAS